ncbi:hypothetical protein BDR03DRAFT_873789 [Suillus americanus]|nr:hypothetical protein BDR03DRAFT_873789 [Suillus americanus]
MLKDAKKYNVSFAPIKLSNNMKQQLPAWYHLGAPPKTYHRTKNVCLKMTHKIRTIKDMMTIAHRPISHPPNRSRSNCACDPCKNDRNDGCKNPHKCLSIAKEILGKLLPKFNPTSTHRSNNLTLTHCHKEKNSNARTSGRGKITFDPTVTEKSNITECFRIFANKDRLTQMPALRLQHPNVRDIANEQPIQIFTDGSCLNNRK